MDNTDDTGQTWTALEDLILVHAVVKEGRNWEKVAERARMAGMARAPSACELAWARLASAGTGEGGAGDASSEEVLCNRLATRLSSERVATLKEAVGAKEQLLRELQTEMRRIRSGAFDSDIDAKVSDFDARTVVGVSVLRFGVGPTSSKVESTADRNGASADASKAPAGLSVVVPSRKRKRSDDDDDDQGQEGAAAQQQQQQQPQGEQAAGIAGDADADADNGDTEGTRGRKRQRVLSGDAASKASKAPKKSSRSRSKQQGKAGGGNPRTKMINSLKSVMKLLWDHSCAGPFRTPVRESVAPNYYTLIKEPRDLTTIRKMITAGDIDSFQAFADNFRLIVTNAIEYNGADSEIAEMARDFGSYGEALLQPYLDGKVGEGDAPLTPSHYGMRRSRRR